MFAKHTPLALSLLLLGGLAHGGDRHHERAHPGPAGKPLPRESFTEETVRKTADGKVYKRKTEQKVTDTGFTRKSTLTNPEGKTASREVSAQYDKNSKTYSKTVKGTDFDGQSWSRDLQAERTPDGYVREDHWRKRDGGEGRREARHQRDEAGVSHDVNTTHADGSTTEKSRRREKP